MGGGGGKGRGGVGGLAADWWVGEEGTAGEWVWEEAGDSRAEGVPPPGLPELWL